MAAYASADDIAARLGRTLDPTIEVPKVNALIEDYSGMISAYCRRVFNPVPDDVKAVVCSEVLKAFNTTPGYVMEHVGDIQVEYSSTAGGLSQAAKNVIKHYRTRVVSIQLEQPAPLPPWYWWSGNRYDF